MTDQEEANLKAERDAVEFERLLEQLGRMGRDKTHPEEETGKDVEKMVSEYGSPRRGRE